MANSYVRKTEYVTNSAAVKILGRFTFSILNTLDTYYLPILMNFKFWNLYIGKGCESHNTY